MFSEVIYADIDPSCKRFVLQEKFHCDDKKYSYYNDFFLPKGSNNKFQIFCYKHGKVYREFLENSLLKEQEYIYIHLQKRKFKNPIIMVKEFYITPAGFIEKHEETTKKIMMKYNPYRCKFVENFERLVFRVRRYLKR